MLKDCGAIVKIKYILKSFLRAWAWAFLEFQKKEKPKHLQPRPEAAAGRDVLQFCAAAAAPCKDRSSSSPPL